jgi:predicted signal transduction protein with EAL and GGDEF domain
MDNDNNIDFKDLWKKQTISQSNIEELLARLKQFKKTSLRSLWIANILLFVTSAFIVFVWMYYQPQFISTKIGIVLVVLAIVMYVVVSNRLLRIYKEVDATQTNQEYLQKLILIKKKQQYIHSVVLSLYFILLGSGICLYMYEYAVRMTVFYAILAYGVTLLWIGFNWFYIRPKQIKKQMEKVNSLISKFEEVNKQLDTE